jgi:glutathione S-transferase
MALTLYHHPLSSFCQKVLVALHEAGVPFEPRLVDLGNPADRAALAALWPLVKFPLLHDDVSGKAWPESSVIIEFLAARFEAAAPLLPADPGAALEVRLWDRVFDQYLQVPMQKVVADSFRAADQHDAPGVAEARALIVQSYGLIEGHLARGAGPWVTGTRLTLADCAALPALYYATSIEPLHAGHPLLAAYFARLLQRPSVQRTLDGARPYLHLYPFRERLVIR